MGIVNKALNKFGLKTKGEYEQLRKELVSLQQSHGFPPGHYYSPLIDKVAVNNKKNGRSAVDGRELPSIDLNCEAQIDLLHTLKPLYFSIQFPIQPGNENRYFYENDFFNYSDAIFLNLLMRHYRPKKIIEIGSGFSSAAMLDTNQAFLGNATKLTFIEPYPEERLYSLLRNNDQCEVLKVFVQDVPLQTFEVLNANDILFIDSSHVSKFESDVNFLFFSVLPALKPGVIIHIHDIFYPFEYPIEWLKQGRSWNEAYLLKAFLQYNKDFEIILFPSYLENVATEMLNEHFPLSLKRTKVIDYGEGATLMQTAGQSIYIRKK